MVDINLKVPAIEKLLDYAASGIGAVAASILAPRWRARQAAAVKRIEAEAEGDSLKLIAKAQAEARQFLVEPDNTGSGILEIGPDGGIAQRIAFQEKKQQTNIASVVRDAAADLDGKEVSDHDPDPDWTARFFDNIQHVSSKELQQIWSRILAGEVESPGRTSLRTLSILKDMTQRQAEMFSEFSRYAINCIVHEESYTAIDPTLHVTIPIVMEELGLIHGSLSVYQTFTVGTDGTLLLEYYNNFLMIEGKPGQKTDIRGFALTGPGTELAQLHGADPHMEYLREFAKFLHGHGCTLKIAPAIKVDTYGTLGCRRSELLVIEPAE